MIQIHPVSDLRNKFSEIEEIVNGGEPVYLFVETKLDEADRIAETSEERYSHERVFGDIRKAVDGNEDLIGDLFL